MDKCPHCGGALGFRHCYTVGCKNCDPEVQAQGMDADDVTFDGVKSGRLEGCIIHYFDHAGNHKGDAFKPIHPAGGVGFTDVTELNPLGNGGRVEILFYDEEAQKMAKAKFTYDDGFLTPQGTEPLDGGGYFTKRLIEESIQDHKNGHPTHKTWPPETQSCDKSISDCISHDNATRFGGSFGGNCTYDFQDTKCGVKTDMLTEQVDDKDANTCRLKFEWNDSGIYQFGAPQLPEPDSYQVNYEHRDIEDSYGVVQKIWYGEKLVFDREAEDKLRDEKLRNRKEHQIAISQKQMEKIAENAYRDELQKLDRRLTYEEAITEDKYAFRVPAGNEHGKDQDGNLLATWYDRHGNIMGTGIIT